MDELEEKVSRLPAWARQYIHDLIFRSKPLVEEAVRAHKAQQVAEDKAKRYRESNEALLELLRRAGESGHDWARTVVSVLESYEIFQQVGTVETV